MAVNMITVVLRMSQYQHGLLTYSLLKTMIKKPGSFNKNINLQLVDWFEETEELVTELQNYQSPQLITPNNLIIGNIDNEVRNLVLLYELMHNSK